MAVDTFDMLLVHRMWQRNLAALADLIRAVPTGDRQRAKLVAAHASELVGALEHHHHHEDELVWPRLRERVPAELALLDQMESDHRDIAALLTGILADLPTWAAEADEAGRDRLADACAQLSDRFIAHISVEEDRVLPLAAAHLSEREWAQLGERGFAAVPPKRRMAVLGYILEYASPTERVKFMRQVPPPARVLYRLAGQRAWTKEVTALRGTAPA